MSEPKERSNITHFGLREGHLFMIDVSPDMFERDSDDDPSYFDQCIEAYSYILSQKLRWNRKDWMGLIFFNSLKDWDKDPKTENIKTVQKLREIETSMLSSVLQIAKYKNTKDHYWDESLDAELDNCLYEAFWLACRSFDSVNIQMPVRHVFFMTCRDNPVPGNSTERHRIHQLAKSCSNLNINLRVIGVGKNWNHELFYKDVDLLANNLDPEDLKPMKIEHLELEVIFPARASDHLPWKIGGDVEIEITLESFSSKTQYIKKTKMDEKTNEILESYRHWGPSGDLSSDEESDEEDEDVPDSVEHGMTFADTLIKFGTSEKKAICAPVEKGIHLLGFKPISIDFIHHVSSPRFANVDSSAPDGTKSLFAALLKNCDDKKVMAICCVSNRTRPYLVKMIPCTKLGGFYVYRIPFIGNVKTLQELENDICDERSSVEVLEDGVKLMSKISKKLGMEWDPWRYRNPKLNHELAYIEALALDSEFTKPQDSTEPPTEVMKTRLGNLTSAFENYFGDLTVTSTFAKKRVIAERREIPDKVTKYSEDYIRDLVDSDTLKSRSVSQLRDMARSLDLQTTGVKITLINRITSYFAK